MPYLIKSEQNITTVLICHFCRVEGCILEKITWFWLARKMSAGITEDQFVKEHPKIFKDFNFSMLLKGLGILS